MVHPTDVALTRLIHGELSLDMLESTLAHVDRCAACGRRLEGIQDLDREVATLLTELDHALPTLPAIPARRLTVQLPRPALAAAIATLLLASAAAAAAIAPNFPLRAWLARTFGAEAHQSVPHQGAPAPTPVPAPAGAPTPDSTSRISVATAEAMVVAFRVPQPFGTLNVAVGDQPNLTLTAIGGAVTYSVGDREIRVDNHQPARTYVLTIPKHLQRVTVMIGGRTLWRQNGARGFAAAPLSIPLSADH